MRYFWHAIILLGVVAGITFLFFAFSVGSEHRITFTDDLPDLTEPTITIADPVQGPDTAAVTIVNFGDYQCESCADLENDLAELMDEFEGNIRLVWKDMPNTESHPEALNAAIAARCAEKQDKFFEYHAYLFANQTQLSPELYTAVAQQLGLKERSFAKCYENQDTLAFVQKSYEEGLALDLTATPTLFVNGERITGAPNKDDLRSMIRSIIKK